MLEEKNLKAKLLPKNVAVIGLYIDSPSQDTLQIIAEGILYVLGSIYRPCV